MKLPVYIFIAVLISCSGSDRKQNTTVDFINEHMNDHDTSIHPVLEIGTYYVTKINQDTIAGILLGAIHKEEDSVYYSFVLSGRFFNTIPSEKEFRGAGLCGLEIPSYPAGNSISSLCRYSISEKNLTLELNKLTKIGYIKFSKKNTYGSTRIIKNFNDLSGEFLSFEKSNVETDKQIKLTGFPSSKYIVINWNQLAIASNQEDQARPEVLWVLSAKTAHPTASALMKEEWWWSPADDLSPFGNDDGADALYIYKDWRENNKNTKSSLFIYYLQKRWNMSFSHINNDSETDLPKIEKENTFYRNVDRAMMSLAFSQLVLEGKISPEFKNLAIKAIRRTKTEFGMNGMTDENKTEYRKRLDKMESILTGL
ncbi:MAG TPA: hypothetical protein VIZ28_01085 [Chitinophagaceae bacterium]